MAQYRSTIPDHFITQTGQTTGELIQANGRFFQLPANLEWSHPTEGRFLRSTRPTRPCDVCRGLRSNSKSQGGETSCVINIRSVKDVLSTTGCDLCRTTKRRCIFAGQSLAWLEAYEQASASNPDKLQLERASRDDDESLKIINLFNWEKNPDGQGKDVTRLSTRCTQCENTGLADCYISRRKLLSGQILSSACARCVRLHSRCEFSEKDLEHIAVYQQSGVKLWEGENTRDQTQTQEPMQLTHGMANASSNCTPADQEKSTISGNQDTPLPRDEYGELYDSLVDDGWQSLRIG